jgi:CRP-like cAMP-binding protein
MDNAGIIQNLKKHISLTDAEVAHFFSLLRHVRLKKNAFLIRSGEASCPFILIKKGCLMTFFTDRNNVHHVIQFWQEMWWTGDLNGLAGDHPSMYSIKAIVPTEVYLLHREAFAQLCTDIPAFDRYFRIIFQHSLISHQKRIIQDISCTAEEKYLTFTENYPQLERILPQKYIASYLGITPEFLSRIRRRLAGKS